MLRAKLSAAVCVIMGVFMIMGSIRILADYRAVSARVTSTNWVRSGRSCQKEIYYLFETAEGYPCQGRDRTWISFKKTGDDTVVYYNKADPEIARASDGVWGELAGGILLEILGIFVIFAKPKNKKEDGVPGPPIELTEEQEELFHSRYK